MFRKSFTLKQVLKFLLGAAALTFMSSCSSNSDNKKESESIRKLDSLFSSIDESGGWMGSISIFQDGEEVYNRAFGYANVEDNVKNDKETKFRIGSVTDVYTATIIMKLVESGKISLDTKLNDYFLEIMKSPRITVEDLLRHRSGIFNLLMDLTYWSYYHLPISEEVLYHKIVDFGLVDEPGKKSQFSSSNYILLGMMAEKIEGKSYSDILDSLICKPLGLKNTYVGSSISIKDNEASSYYDRLPRWNLAKETDLSTAIGEASIVSTPTEVNLFLTKLFDGKVLSDSSVDKMKQVVDGFSLGMQTLDREYPNLGVVGNIDGFNTEVVYFTDKDRNVVVSYFSNGSSSSSIDIMGYALAVYFNKEDSLPEFKKYINLSDQEMEKYEGVYSNSQYSTTFEIVKDTAEHCLMFVSSNDKSDPSYIGCYKNGEFSVQMSDEEVPIEFTIFPENGTLRLSNGMELKKVKS
ncbi:MAG TPA: serine hydrolase domain-containing protein [Paludibacteraceae bacterium]|nr:serine hydrolase domain-containing protein [Paludibacteraceae bacterium]HQF50590.1 serine hydrolase domain-containing protein [Paludibacteraceae bacterium]HQJ89191.1 serine hydrolase domain-containing protein [Paludibacteraceae bacterium]